MMADDEKWNLTVTWRIEDYSSCQMKPGEKLASPEFTFDALDNSKWFLSVYPGGWKEDDKEIFPIFLNRRDSISEKNYNITYELQINTAGKNNILVFQYSHTFTNGGSCLLPRIITLKEVISELKKCSFDDLFIQCSLKRNDQSEKLSSKKELRTCILSHKNSFEWKVKFFEQLQYMKGQKLFYIGDQFYQINIAIPSDDVTITLQKLQDKTSNNVVVGKISLLDTNNNEVFSKRGTFIFDAKLGHVAWEFILLTRRQLLDDVTEYVKDGDILLLCEFSLNKGKGFEAVPEANSHILVSIITLSDDFRGLMVDKANFDVKLLAKNNVEVKAHKDVLAARSPVFCAMFNHDMTENRTGVVIMDDVDSGTLESFLKFLYTGVVHDLDSEEAIELLLIADKYQVPTLKQVCAYFLMSALSVDNVCEILTKADWIGHEHLKSTCLDFVVHCATRIFSSPEFLSWMKNNLKLASEVTLYLGKMVETLMNK